MFKTITDFIQLVYVQFASWQCKAHFSVTDCMFCSNQSDGLEWHACDALLRYAGTGLVDSSSYFMWNPDSLGHCEASGGSGFVEALIQELHGDILFLTTLQDAAVYLLQIPKANFQEH